MTPQEIYNTLEAYAPRETNICELHSACSPHKHKIFRCGQPESRHNVLDFDAIKDKFAIENGEPPKKSADAATVTPKGKRFCFIELKSWTLAIKYARNETEIKDKGQKFEAQLPEKLRDSIAISKAICRSDNAFEEDSLAYILLTDISVEENGIEAFASDLFKLAESSSNWIKLCNRLSRDIMNGIQDVETYYWECRDFDKKIASI